MSTDAVSRPRFQVALAMDEETKAVLFDEPEWQQIEQLSILTSRVPLTDLADVDPARLAQTEVLITGWGAPWIGLEALEAMPALRYVIHAGGTVKTFLAPEVFERGIQVSSAAVANAIPVAEYTLASIIMGLKRASRFRDQLLSTSEYRNISKVPAVGMFGVSIGIVGASQVGRRVINLLSGFDVRVLVYDPYLSAQDAAGLGAELVDLDRLCRESDVVSLHAPATADTWQMIGPAQLAAMANGAVLINTARGSLVDTAALETELVTGRLDAFLDVTDPEPLPASSVLYRLSNVFLTPHIAGAMGNEVKRLGQQAISELGRLSHGLPFEYPVVVNDLSRIA